MPIFKQRIVLEAVRNLKVFLHLETGIVRDGLPDPEARAAVPETPGKTAAPTAPPPGGQETAQHQRVAQRDRKIRQVREQLEEKDKEIARLRGRLVAGDGPPAGGAKPENMIWLFGTGRSGSSWLSSMMADLPGHTRWDEPYVGEIFGTAYYLRVGDRMRNRKDFILGDRYREARTNSIRNFVLEGALVRFPEVAEGGYLVVKEPNGSVGAPLLMAALTESRMVLLVRDPRDVVSSALAANRKGSWGSQWRADGSAGESLVDTDPDEFVRRWANMYLASLGKATEAYEAHEAPRVVVTYEDLRTDTLETMKGIYSALEISIDEAELARVVEKHAWENIPEERKGADKPRRKAKPGGWKEDLTAEQARIVEEAAAPILDKFYPGWVPA